MAAVNVFGVAVTDATVRQYFPDKQVITRKDRAYLAYNLKEADKKQEEAEEYVQQQLKEWQGEDGYSATLITIYNATGDTLTYYRDYNNVGHIQGPGYPKQIENGQWAAFLHVGSHGAVAYRGPNNEGKDCAWLHAWYNVTNDSRKYVFPEIQYDYDKNDWKYIAPSIKYEHHSNSRFDCYTTASMSQDYPYKYSGTMTLVFIP